MPELFGRYQLLQKLATGGMAEIYLARQQGPEGFSKLLVIKRILPHLAGNDEFVKMFLDEARIAARLNHANVVQIFDLGAIGEHFFIAMEYLHGEDARRVWKQADKAQQPLPVPLACRIVMDACAGLDYAHKKLSDAGQPLNIVHRDVSPQNIIVTFEGGVKVVDFGIAKAADQSSVTRSGVVKGKYSYMSPEQAAGKRVDARTDQFALGIVLYELITGERLFKRASDIETLKAVERCQVPPPSQVSANVPSSLDPIVMRALERDLEKRYPDCQSFQLALEGWLVENRLPSSSAQLASFLSGIYAERLDEEKRVGHPLWDESSGPSANSSELLPPVQDAPPSVRTPSHQTAVAKRQSVSALKPVARAASGGNLAVALSGPRPTIEGPPPPPPLKSTPNLPRATASERPAIPTVPIGEDDIVEGGNTLAELSQTLSTTSNSVPSAVARRQSRRSLVIGLGAGAVVVFFGIGLFAFLTQGAGRRPERPVATPSEPGAKGGPELPSGTARLMVTTEPPGAEVSVDGQPRGKSPLSPIAVPAGSSVTIAAHLEGYGDQRVTETVAHDLTVPLKLPRLGNSPVGEHVEHTEHAAPVREATLSLDSPIPLAVKLDGKTISLPLRARVSPGRHRLEVSSATLDYSQVFEPTLRPGETQGPRLAPAIGKLLVTTGINTYGDVEVGGIKRGQTPMPAFDLAEGVHTVTVTNEELGKTVRRQVTITPGKPTKLSVNLEE